MTGRCGPCCSVEPTGTMIMASRPALSLRSGAVRLENSSGRVSGCMAGRSDELFGEGMNYSSRFTPVIARIDQLLDGLWLTLALTAAVVALGFLLGVGGALASRSRLPALRRAVVIYVE